MRLAYVIGRYPAVAQTFIEGEISELRRRGFTVDVFSIWRTPSKQLLTAKDRVEARSTHAILPPQGVGLLGALASAIRADPRRFLRTLLQALTLAPKTPRGLALGVSWFLEALEIWRRCRARGVRHLHAHIVGSPSSAAMLAAFFGNGCEPGEWSWSWTVHGPMDFYNVDEYRIASKCADARFTVAVSDFARSQLMYLTEPTLWPRIRVVRCGVDTTWFAPTAAAPVSGELLSVGRLARAKGQRTLLDAIAALEREGRDVHLTIVGDGPERAELQRYAHSLGLSGRVTLTGLVDQVAVRAAYAQSQIFCLSSFGEGVPVAMMEAMAMELPTVAPGIMGIPELVSHGKTGLLVRPARSDELAQALRELLDRPDLRATIGRAGRAKVRDEYELAQNTAQLGALSHEFLHPVAGPTAKRP